MLLELYITVMVFNFIIFGIAFFGKNEWMWALTLVLTAFLFFASYDITQNIAVVDNETQPSPGVVHFDYSIMTNHNQDKALSFFALGMFLLALLLFISDLFQNFRVGKMGKRENVPPRY